MTRRVTLARHVRREAGSVTILAAGILFLAGVIVLASVDVMRAIQARARAQVAADAAALAAAQEIALPSGRPPAEVAAEYAGRNHATLLSCVCDPGTAEAVVEVEAPVDLIFVGPDRTVRASRPGGHRGRWRERSGTREYNGRRCRRRGTRGMGTGSPWAWSTTRWPSGP